MANPRKEIITTGEIYHVYNKTIGNEELFLNNSACSRFIESLGFYRKPHQISLSRFKSLNKEIQLNYLNSHTGEKLVEIYAFTLMPNHYHLILKQLKDNGISDFISKLQNSYAKFYNKKYKWNGGLFIRPFKSKRVESDEHFVHLIRYVLLNPVTGFLIHLKELEKYKNTSFIHSVGNFNYDFIDKKYVNSFFKDINDFKSFIYNQSDYQKNLGIIKKLTLEMI